MRSKAGEGMRWTLFAVACVGLVGCGGGSSGGNGSDPFDVVATDYELDGSEAAVDLNDTDQVLAAGLAAVTMASGVATLGIADTIEGYAGVSPGHSDIGCDSGAGTIDIAEGGDPQRILTFDFDQCFEAMNPDFTSDGQFTIEITQEGSPTQGTLKVGDAPFPFVNVTRNAPDSFTFVQTLGNVGFDGDPDGSPFDLTAPGFRYIAGSGNAPSEGPVTPDRWLETRLSPSSLANIDTSKSGTDILLDLVLGDFGAQGHNLPVTCRAIGRAGVVTVDTVRVNRQGTAIAGTLSVVNGDFHADITFHPDGSADVTPASGAGQPYDAAAVAAHCAI